MALGVQDVKALAGAVAKGASVAAKVLADGDVNLRDMVHVPELFSALRGLAGVNYLSVLPQLTDLDEAEKAELAADFRAKFDLPQDTVEVVVEQGYAILLEAIQAVLAFVKVGQKVKAA
jgi:hypothetical protein